MRHVTAQTYKEQRMGNPDDCGPCLGTGRGPLVQVLRQLHVAHDREGVPDRVVVMGTELFVTLVRGFAAKGKYQKVLKAYGLTKKGTTVRVPNTFEHRASVKKVR